MADRWGIERDRMVRPFYPGGDFEAFDYPGGAVVVDNPPFSILSRICEFYVERGIPFFLFSPALTSLSGTISTKLNHIYPDASIVYENGAKVRTAFVTTFGNSIAETAPELGMRIKGVQDARLHAEKPPLPKYEYPSHVLTAAMMGKYAKHGIDLSISKSECVRINALDAQRLKKKGIFGSGLLLSDGAAARHAAAMAKLTRHVDHDTEAWELSERELQIVADLSKKEAIKESQVKEHGEV